MYQLRIKIHRITAMKTPSGSYCTDVHYTTILSL